MKKLLSLFLTLLICISFMAPSATYAATIKLNKSKLELSIGDTYQLEISGVKQTIKWSSSDKSIATVSKNGKVTAKSIGKSTITATVNKKKCQCKVTVTDKIVTIKLSYLNFDGIDSDEYMESLKEDTPEFITVEQYDNYLLITLTESDRIKLIQDFDQYFKVGISELLTETETNEVIKDFKYDSFNHITISVNSDQYDSCTGWMMSLIYNFISDFYDALNLVDVEDRTFSIEFVDDQTGEILDQYDSSDEKVQLIFSSSEDSDIINMFEKFQKMIPQSITIEKQDESIIISVDEILRKALVLLFKQEIDDSFSTLLTDSYYGDVITDIQYNDTLNHITLYVNGSNYDPLLCAFLEYGIIYYSDIYQALQLIDYVDRTYYIEFIDNETGEILDKLDLTDPEY